MSEELPAGVVEVLGPVNYVSTACETAHLLAACSNPNLEQVLAAQNLPNAKALTAWHHQRCRHTHKFTGAPCRCDCHKAQR